MKGSTKALLAVLGVGATVAGIILWKRRGKPAEQASASLEIIPGQGIGALPGTLTEGVAGNLAVVTITNNSVYSGSSVKAPWTFACLVGIVYGGYTITVGGNCALGAGETKAFSFVFDLPYGKNGSGTAWGDIYPNPGSTTLLAKTAVVNIAVAAAGISPAGGLSW